MLPAVVNSPVPSAVRFVPVPFQRPVGPVPTTAKSPTVRAPITRSPNNAHAVARTWFNSHLPELQTRFRAYFCRFKADARAEAIQDCLAVIWQRALAAARRSRSLDEHTPYNAVVFAGKAYRCGRRFAGSSTTDVMAEGTRAVGRVTIASVEDWVATKSEVPHPGRTLLRKMLADHRTWNDPFEAARVQHDYPAVLAAEGVSAKARSVFDELARTHGSARVMDMAAALRVSPARICQLKEQLAEAPWRRGYGAA